MAEETEGIRVRPRQLSFVAKLAAPAFDLGLFRLRRHAGNQVIPCPGEGHGDIPPALADTSSPALYENRMPAGLYERDVLA
jgi:hypothetical protein